MNNISGSNFQPLTSLTYQTDNRQLKEILVNGIYEYQNEIEKNKAAEAIAESDTPATVRELLAASTSSAQPMDVRIVPTYFSSALELIDAVTDDLEQLNENVIRELEITGQRARSLEEKNKLLEREVNAIKNIALNIFQISSHNEPLSKAEIQLLINILKNESKNYGAIFRGNAAYTLGAQPTLSEQEHAALEAVLQDSDGRVRVQAAVALHAHRKLPDAGRQILVDAVANKNGLYAVVPRSNAAHALGKQLMLSEQEHTILEAALQDGDGGVRVQATVALHAHRKLPDAGRQILVDAVANKNGTYTAESRSNAAYALSEQPTLSEQEHTVLEAALQDSDGGVRVQAAVALHEHRKLPDAGRQILVDAVANKNGAYVAVYRGNAAYALGEQPTLSEQEHTILEAALQDSDGGVRVQAAVALHEHRKLPGAGRQILVDAVAKKNGAYTAVHRSNAVYALSKQATLSEQEHTILEAALQDSDGGVRVQAAIALYAHRKLPDAGRQILVDAVANKNGLYAVVPRSNATQALGKQPTLSEQEHTALEAALQDSDGRVKVRAAIALHAHRKLSDAGRQILVDAVANKNGTYTAVQRGNAARALGAQATLSEQEHIILEAALQDSDGSVRMRAAIALHAHRKLPDTGRQILVDAVANKNGAYVAVYRGSAARALSEQSTLSEQERTILEAALQDSDGNMRVEAAVALHAHRKLPGAGRQILMDVVANKNGTYTAESRSNAAYVLGEQSTLSEQERTILEAALQDSDEGMRVRAAVALHAHRKLPDAGRQILVDAVANKNEAYVAVYRGSAAHALGVVAQIRSDSTPI